MTYGLARQQLLWVLVGLLVVAVLVRMFFFGSPDSTTSADALQRAGEPVDTRDLDRLIAIVRGDDVDRAAQAALTLGQLDKPSARQTIEQLLPEQDRPAVREALIVGYGNLLNRDNYELIEPYADSPDPEVRAAVMRALGRMQAIEAMPTLIRGLKDDDLAVRRRADGAVFNILRRDVGYEPDDSPTSRRQAIRRVEKTWPAMVEMHEKFVQSQINKQQARN